MDRDIAMGEELFYDYGIEWVNAWSTYLAKLSEDFLFKLEKIRTQEDTGGEVESKEDIIASPFPKFSHFIGASTGLFVPAWEDEMPIPKIEEDVDYDCDADSCQVNY